MQENHLFEYAVIRVVPRVEREEFLNQSETALFEKMQAQQEKETELEQREEDLKRLARQTGVLKDEPKEPMEKA